VNSLRRFLVTMAVFTPPCLAQTGIVTFYSCPFPFKDELKASLMPAGRIPFGGWLFDGKKRLAHASPGHFVRFRLATGQHTFSVPWKSKEPGKTVLRLNVEEGAHYCVRLSAKYVSPVLVPMVWVDSMIELVPCGQAFQEAGATKPLDSSRVDAHMRDKLDSLPSFPNENSPN
jgi:hypothetical protein